MKINDLKVGQFGKVNGSVVYRFKITQQSENMWPSLDGCFIVEKHPQKSLGWLDLETGTGTSIIDSPQHKHVSNTIKQLKDSLKFKLIDNLTYVENYAILKNYLK